MLSLFRSRSLLLFALVCLTLLIGVWNPVHAQDATPEPDPTADTTAEETDTDWYQTVDFWSVVVISFYILQIFLIRWYIVAVPTRELVESQIMAVRNNLRIEQAEPDKTDALEKAVMEASETLLKKAEENIEPNWQDRIAWSGGRELGAWRMIHQVERQAALIMLPKEVKATLASQKGLLEKMDSAEAKSLLDSITLDDTQNTIEDYRAQLKEARRIIYNDRDARFTQLAKSHNKALYLIVTTLLLMMGLAIVIGNTELFFLGALGGIMSRLTRVVRAKAVPSDYGASWTTLFLSPVSGAVAAWSGILLISILASEEFNLLGGFFLDIWQEPAAPTTLGIAFILGFSERYFDNITQALESNTKDRIEPEGDDT